MIDFQALFSVMIATENNPNVNMGFWNYGTSQCMIGSFCSANKNDRLQLTNCLYLSDKPTIFNEAAIAERFGITKNEAYWIFTLNPFGELLCANAVNLSKEQALARLRKFIYYKMHKQEMVVEHPSRISPLSSFVTRGRREQQTTTRNER